MLLGDVRVTTPPSPSASGKYRTLAYMAQRSGSISSCQAGQLAETRENGVNVRRLNGTVIRYRPARYVLRSLEMT